MNNQEVIMEFLESIIQSDYLVLVPIIIGLAGITYAYRNQKRITKKEKTRKIRCSGVSYNVISKDHNSFPKLKVHYDNSELSSFSSTRITIKNIGTEILRINDIATKSPLTIKTKSGENELLSYKIVEPTKEINNVVIKKQSETEMRIEFEYIEPNDEIHIEILHTGEKTTDLIGTGKIIGIDKEFSVDAFEQRIDKFLNGGGPQSLINKIIMIPLIISLLIILILTFLVFYFISNIWIRITLTIIVSIFIFRMIRKTNSSMKKLKDVEIEKIFNSMATDKSTVEFVKKLTDAK